MKITRKTDFKLECVCPKGKCPSVQVSGTFLREILFFTGHLRICIVPGCVRVSSAIWCLWICAYSTDCQCTVMVFSTQVDLVVWMGNIARFPLHLSPYWSIILSLYMPRSRENVHWVNHKIFPFGNKWTTA